MSSKAYFVDSVAQAIAHAQGEALSRHGQIGLIRKVEASEIVSTSRTVRVQLQVGETRKWFTVQMEQAEGGWAIQSDNKEKKEMNGLKLEKMGIVKRILTEGEFSVRALFHPTLFKVLGGEQMLALIEAHDSTLESWKKIGRTASEMRGLDAKASWVIEWLVVYILSEEESVSHWGKDEALRSAQEDLGNWIFNRKAAEMQASKQAVWNAAAVAKAYEEAGQKPDGDEEESSPFERAVWRLDQILNREAHEARKAVYQHWLSLGIFPMDFVEWEHFSPPQTPIGGLVLQSPNKVPELVLIDSRPHVRVHFHAGRETWIEYMQAFEIIRENISLNNAVPVREDGSTAWYLPAEGTWSLSPAGYAIKHS